MVADPIYPYFDSLGVKAYTAFMRKIDLHIHTVAVDGKDASFNFDIDNFQKFTDELAIDAVAITNHNHFNLSQFNEITSKLTDVKVFPGIEIDFQSGHLLLISENTDLTDFDSRCTQVEKEFTGGSQISLEKLKEIFTDLSNYLLIPHYEKRPKVSASSLELMKEEVFAGEVRSPKIFSRKIKEVDTLTPVLFSDARISDDLDNSKHQGKQTFINTNSDSLSLDTVKGALRDKNKVFLSNSKKHGFFQIFNNGQELSTGLNIVLGGRSSGKTTLLNNLKDIYDTEEKSVKYIEQFALVNEDEGKFNKMLEKEKSAVREEYLQDFRAVVEDATEIDTQETNHKLEKYVETLLDFASNEKLLDEYSRAALYTEIPFQIVNNEGLERIIEAVLILQNNTVYKETINKRLLEDKLISLSSDLEILYKEKVELKLKKEWVNELIKDTSRQLKSKSSSSSIEYNDIDFYGIKLEKEKIRRFNAIANTLKEQNTISEDTTFGKFKIQAISSRYTGAGEMNAESKSQAAFTQAYKEYDSPIIFLDELKKLGGLEKSELYKYFCKVTYQVLNEYDKKVSGGERAEFNLLKALEDARQYDMLLIDEPESSFDNLFLKNNVNTSIKEISKELPVVVVTHNNTVGMMLKPDYILCTQREIIEGTDEYNVYSGSPGDKEFTTAKKDKKVGSFDELLKTLEAGEDAYITRKSLYNNFK